MAVYNGSRDVPEPRKVAGTSLEYPGIVLGKTHFLIFGTFFSSQPLFFSKSYLCDLSSSHSARTALTEQNLGGAEKNLRLLVERLASHLAFEDTRAKSAR